MLGNETSFAEYTNMDSSFIPDYRFVLHPFKLNEEKTKSTLRLKMSPVVKLLTLLGNRIIYSVDLYRGNDAEWRYVASISRICLV